MATTTATPKTKTTGGSFLLEDHNLTNVFTPEDFNEHHQMIAQTAEEFATNEILPNVEKIEHKDLSGHARSAEEGRRDGPEQCRYPRRVRRPGDGQSLRPPSSPTTWRSTPASPTTWGGHSGIGTLPIVFFGTEEQKKKYLPKLAAGEIVGAYALSEAPSAPTR